MVNFLLDRKPSRQAINEALPAAAAKGHTTIAQKLIDSAAEAVSPAPPYSEWLTLPKSYRIKR
jgi:hypothetical protein